MSTDIKESSASAASLNEKAAANFSNQNENRPPPTYSSLADAVAADIRALSLGDPRELISVPMVHSTEVQRNPFSKRGKVTQTVIVRKMTREHFLKHYAKDSKGNYIGTDRPAVDAGLVFVPNQNSSEHLLQQVHKVAFGREHDQGSFRVAYAMDYVGG